MAFRVAYTDDYDQTTNHWEIVFVHHLVSNAVQKVTVMGYKNKAAKLAGKRGIPFELEIRGAAYQVNMTLNEIEAALILMPPFIGAVPD